MSRTSSLILSSLFKTPKTMDTWDISKCERTEDNEPFHSVTATTFWFVFLLTCPDLPCAWLVFVPKTLQARVWCSWFPEFPRNGGARVWCTTYWCLNYWILPPIKHIAAAFGRQLRVSWWAALVHESKVWKQYKWLETHKKLMRLFLCHSLIARSSKSWTDCYG